MNLRPLALLLLAGCIHGRDFTNSSADFNHGSLHEVRVRAELDPVAEQIAAIMRDRGALIVKRRELSNGSVVLSFRQSRERAVGAHVVNTGPRTVPTRIENDYVEYGSLYYVELAPAGSRTLVKALGLPVVDGVTACPEIAQRLYRDCRPAGAGMHDSYADGIEEELGLRVDGAVERDHVMGLLAELQLRWPESGAASDPVTSSAADQAFAR